MEFPEVETTVVKDFESYVNLLKKSFNSEDPNMREALNLKNDTDVLKTRTYPVILAGVSQQ